MCTRGEWNLASDELVTNGAAGDDCQPTDVKPTTMMICGLYVVVFRMFITVVDACVVLSFE